MEYPEDLNVDSDWFPFDSKADALIYLWDAPGKSNRLPQDRLTSLLQMLPLIGVDGITLQSGQKFRDKYAARIPLMKIHTTTAVKSIRHHRKAKKKTDSNNQPNTSEKIVKCHVQVPYFCHDEYIIRTMADPLWSPTLRFGLDPIPSNQQIRQFNQTPFAREILRWSTLKSIDRINEHGVNQPIEVGHWYNIAHTDYPTTKSRQCLGLITKFTYEGGTINRSDTTSERWWPTLMCHIRVCTIHTNQRSTYTLTNMSYGRVRLTETSTTIDPRQLRHQVHIFRGKRSQFNHLPLQQQTAYDGYVDRQLKNTDSYNNMQTPFLALPPAPKRMEHLSSQPSQLTFARSILHSPLPNTHTSSSQILKSITSPRSQTQFQASISNPKHISRRVFERSVRKRKHNQRTIYNTRDKRLLERCKKKRANAELMLLEMQRSIITKSRLPTSSLGLRLCAQALSPAS